MMPKPLLPAALLLLAACAGKTDPTQIRAPGYVEATEMRLATKLGGTLVSFALEEGDRVEVGQEVARFQTTDHELALAAARAEVELTRAQAALVEKGFRREEIAEAEAQVARAEVELAAAERELARFQGLLDTGSGTEKARDDARTRRDAAEKSVAAGGAQLKKLRAGFRTEEIDAARARLAAAEARVAQIEQQIRDATIIAPTRGVMTEKLVEAGEIVPPGTRLAVVSQLDTVDLVAYLAGPDLGRVRLGQKVRVTTDDGQSREGTLSFISPEAEFTPKNVQTRDERIKLVYKIKIALANEDGLFKPGMPAEAHLSAQPPQVSGAAP